MKRAFLAVVVLGAALRASAAVPLPPRPGHYATDRAGALDAATARALDEKLAAFERETSNQVVVYLDRKMPEGTTLEEVANAAFHEWQIGQKDKSNGVLFLVFIDDRKMRIEVGRGLEGALPDVLAGRVLREQVRPRFGSGDIAGGVNAGVDAILSIARGEGYKGTGATAAETTRVHRGDAAAWIVFALFFGICGLAVILPIVLVFRKARRQGWRSVVVSGGSGSDWSSSSSSDSSWSSSDSGSSSDFSGGGGDSGGGGASDSW